jgi:hypothetical protein
MKIVAEAISFTIVIFALVQMWHEGRGVLEKILAHFVGVSFPLKLIFIFSGM